MGSREIGRPGPVHGLPYEQTASLCGVFLLHNIVQPDFVSVDDLVVWLKMAGFHVKQLGDSSNFVKG